MEAVLRGISFREQCLGNEQVCSFELNCTRTSYEAIKKQQLGAIDAISFKEMRLFGEKALDRQETDFAQFD